MKFSAGQGELACHQRAPFLTLKAKFLGAGFIGGSTSNAPAVYMQWDSYL